jgi:aminopeptidase I
MTRHTPDFLRARSSNLSIRSMAMMQSSGLQSPRLASETPKSVEARELKPEAFTKPYLDFMTGNPTVFHAVSYFKEELAKAGYEEVSLAVLCVHAWRPARSGEG